MFNRSRIAPIMCRSFQISKIHQTLPSEGPPGFTATFFRLFRRRKYSRRKSETYRKISKIVGTMSENVRNCRKHVGNGRKNVGFFRKNVWLYRKNVGIYPKLSKKFTKDINFYTQIKRKITLLMCPPDLTTTFFRLFRRHKNLSDSTENVRNCWKMSKIMSGGDISKPPKPFFLIVRQTQIVRSICIIFLCYTT